jgi:hypothetical protein
MLMSRPGNLFAAARLARFAGASHVRSPAGTPNIHPSLLETSASLGTIRELACWNKEQIAAVLIKASIASTEAGSSVL